MPRIWGTMSDPGPCCKRHVVLNGTSLASQRTLHRGPTDLRLEEHEDGQDDNHGPESLLGRMGLTAMQVLPTTPLCLSTEEAQFRTETNPWHRPNEAGLPWWCLGTPHPSLGGGSSHRRWNQAAGQSTKEMENGTLPCALEDPGRISEAGRPQA